MTAVGQDEGQPAAGEFGDTDEVIRRKAVQGDLVVHALLGCSIQAGQVGRPLAGERQHGSNLVLNHVVTSLLGILHLLNVECQENNLRLHRKSVDFIIEKV